jgi:DNA-binding response OmpR family regulator
MIDNNSVKIWILEDDNGCQFVHEQTLGDKYLIKFFKRISEFTEELKNNVDRPALLIADLNLEDGNFMSFLNTEEANTIFNIPFIIVSSIDDAEALRFCFAEGAIDYLTKPFRKNELLVKVENILNKRNTEKTVAIAEKNKKSLAVDGVVINNLTSKQKQLLNLFLEDGDRIVTREDILEKVWGRTNVHPKTVDVHMYNLRRKIHDFGYIIRSEGGGKWSLIHERA